MKKALCCVGDVLLAVWQIVVWKYPLEGVGPN